MSDSTKSNLYWNTLIRIPNQIICFAISIVVARKLTPSDFGIMAIAMMVIGYANLFSNIGMCEAVIQKQIQNKKLINSIFTVDLCISTVLAVLFYLLSDFIALNFSSPECASVIRIVCSVFILTSFEAMAHALLRRDMRFKVVSIVETSKGFTMSVLTLILALLDFKYWALVYGQIIPLFIFTIVLCFKVGWIPKIKYNHSQMINVYNFGIWNFLKTQTNFLSTHIDKIIIGKYLGAGPLGLYDKAMSISFVPLYSFTLNINSVMFSSFSKCSKELTVLKSKFKKSLGVISVFNFPLYVGLIIIAPYFVNVMLGEKWTPMISAFQIILAGCIIKSLGGIIANLNIATGKYKENSQYLMIATAIFFICSIIMIKNGIIGISFAFLIFCMVEIMMLMSVAAKKLRMNVFEIIKALMPASVGSIIMYIVCYVAEKTSNGEYTIYNMLFLIVIGAVTYIAYCLLAKFEINIYLRKNIFRDIFGKIYKEKKDDSI